MVGGRRKDQGKRVVADKALRERVLVAVVKDRRDLELILKKKWYRIPVAHAPTLRFQYLAFYQPAGFGRQGKRIVYYAYVGRKRIVQRKKLLPKEAAHPRANEYYARVALRQVLRLSRPIKNTSPRRVSFGFTTLERLRAARNILQLYAVPETEILIAEALAKAGIDFEAQKYITSKSHKPRGLTSRKKRPRGSAYRRYRVDFAIPFGTAGVAIECDNKKAHQGKRQLGRDSQKDAWLEQKGWRVVRLKEKDILQDLEKCLRQIKEAMQMLG